MADDALRVLSNGDDVWASASPEENKVIVLMVVAAILFMAVMGFILESIK